MNEFALIGRLLPGLATNPTVVTGAGDDCAVLDLGLTDRWLLLKTDAVVEGIHFLPDTAPQRVGHKALARCLSDLAAMAGNPTAAVITLGLPPGYPVESVEHLYAGINALARRYDVAIVGGETTTSPERLWLSVAALGWVPRGRALLRSGAQVGDALFVTGELGGSISGRHLDFLPRLPEAQWLAERGQVHSMIDLSDGLAGDLRHLLQGGAAGAELLTSAVPISRAARLAAKANPTGKTPLLAALTDGEDFELLFTVPRGATVPLLDAWKARFPEVRLSCIGKITSSAGITLRDRRGTHPLTAHGYVHFA